MLDWPYVEDNNEEEMKMQLYSEIEELNIEIWLTVITKALTQNDSNRIHVYILYIITIEMEFN